MHSANDVQLEIIAQFNRAGDALDQFDVLLQLAATLDEMPKKDKVDEARIEGCQSQVWLYLEWSGERPGASLLMRADSDTLMVRGVLKIIESMFQGRSAAEISDCPVTFVEMTELRNVFDSKRQAGVASIVGRIREFAREAQLLG